jgi:hypothetical protein
MEGLGNWGIGELGTVYLHYFYLYFILQRRSLFGKVIVVDTAACDIGLTVEIFILWELSSFELTLGLCGYA